MYEADLKSHNPFSHSKVPVYVWVDDLCLSHKKISIFCIVYSFFFVLNPPQVVGVVLTSGSRHNKALV